MKQIVLLYMPVIHRGYLDFLEKHGRKDECFLLGRSALRELGPEADYLIRKDHAIRGLPDEQVRRFVESLGLFEIVQVLKRHHYFTPAHITCPDEDASRLAVERFFPGAGVTYDDSLRLRYDRRGVDRIDPVPETAQVTSEEAHQMLMGKAEELAARSKDWWLSVGALISRDGMPIFSAWNKSVPDADMQNILGDPRSLYSRGEGTGDTLVRHAERSLVSQAARVGVSLLGTDAYVTHFPCVPCAASLAEAGIKRLFFKNGYSRLESAEVLRTEGVEMIRII